MVLRPALTECGQSGLKSSVRRLIRNLSQIGGKKRNEALERVKAAKWEPFAKCDCDSH